MILCKYVKLLTSWRCQWRSYNINENFSGRVGMNRMRDQLGVLAHRIRQKHKINRVQKDATSSSKISECAHAFGKAWTSSGEVCSSEVFENPSRFRHVGAFGCVQWMPLPFGAAKVPCLLHVSSDTEGGRQWPWYMRRWQRSKTLARKLHTNRWHSPRPTVQSFVVWRHWNEWGAELALPRWVENAKYKLFLLSHKNFVAY